MRDLTRHPRRGFTTIELPFDRLRTVPAVRRGKRSAFTTIELLVVIGIILLLMGILVMGFRHWDAMASGKQTRAQLGLCKTMLTEYERISGFQYIEETPPFAGTVAPIYIDRPTGPYALAPNFDLSANGSSDLTNHGSGSARYFAPAVVRMRMDINGSPSIMKTLARIPANRTLLSNVPANRLLEGGPGMAAPSFDVNPQSAGTSPPFVTVLDGWANPIIFVPRGGMIVNIKDPANPNAPPTQLIVRTSGLQRYTGGAPPRLSPTDRPFFASAGQDGDFTTGEDNVYSFQQD